MQRVEHKDGRAETRNGNSSYQEDSNTFGAEGIKGGGDVIGTQDGGHVAEAETTGSLWRGSGHCLRCCPKQRERGSKSVVFLLPLSLPSHPHVKTAPQSEGREPGIWGSLQCSMEQTAGSKQANDGHTVVEESVYSTMSAFLNPRASLCAGRALCHPPEVPREGLVMIAMVWAVPEKSCSLGEMDWFSPHTFECFYTHMGNPQEAELMT